MTAVLDPQSTPLAGVRPGAFGNATHLICRACGQETALGPYYACLECFGPLEVGYAYPRVTREQLESGPRSIWRYAPLLPVPADIASFRSTDPGFTRLVDARHLADELGLRQLWVKDDSGNPTHSFKDRVVAVALSAARELGLQVLACPVHREPGQRRRRRRGPGGHRLGGLRPGEPRAGQDRGLGGLRHHPGGGPGDL